MQHCSLPNLLDSTIDSKGHFRYRLIQLTPWPQQASHLATQQWAQADLVHASELMRSLHCDLPAAMARSAQAAEELRRRLSMDRVTQHLLASLND